MCVHPGMGLSFLRFSGCGRRKALAEVVEAGEEHHAGKQGHVVARVLTEALASRRRHSGLGSAVSDQVAHGDVRREAHNLSTLRSRLRNVKYLLRKKLRILVST